MAKRVDPLKAKAAKQKKMAIGLCVLFVLVLAYQGPKTLKMLKGPPTAAAATDGSDPTALPAGVEAPAGVPAPTTTPPAAGAPTAPGAPPATPTDTTSQPAVLANSDLPVTAGQGQLLSFEQFESKDPFKQQAEVTADPDTDVDDDQRRWKSPTPATTRRARSAARRIRRSRPAASAAPAPSGGSGSSAAAPPRRATTISVNGVVETIVEGSRSRPTSPPSSSSRSPRTASRCRSASQAARSRAAARRSSSRSARSLTLQNTADGSVYKLVLLTVAGFVTPTSKG